MAGSKGPLDLLMAEVRGESHHDWFEMLSIRGALRLHPVSDT